jgi:hypothetical protein
MCIVHRFTNKCGHVNDHVIMLCRWGKPKSPRLDGYSLRESTNTTAASDSTYLDQSKLVKPMPASTRYRDATIPRAS